MGENNASSSEGGVVTWMLVTLILLATIAAFATYAVVLAAVGGSLALGEALARRRGRAYVAPKERFMAVWSRGMSPIDRGKWVTPKPHPPTDPRLLPGQLTGALRIDDRGVDYTVLDGPFDEVTFKLALANHGTEPIRLTSVDDLDLQVWTPHGTVLATSPRWSLEVLPPGESANATATVVIVDRQPIERIAIAHRGAAGVYVFLAMHPELAAGPSTGERPQDGPHHGSSTPTAQDSPPSV